MANRSWFIQATGWRTASRSRHALSSEHGWTLHQDGESLGLRQPAISLAAAHGLAGNVFEWCEDWHDAKNVHKVVHGGSYENAFAGREGRWNPSPLGDLLASRRQPAVPDSRNGHFGFRIVAEKPLAKDAR